MIQDLFANDVVMILDILPNAPAPGGVHLQQNLSFHLKNKKQNNGMVQRTVWKDELVAGSDLESLRFATLELCSIAKVDCPALMYPNKRQAPKSAGWSGRITPFNP